MSNLYLTEVFEMKNEGEIRIYVACLAAYNIGYLHSR
jgi:hypothetical protein